MDILLNTYKEIVFIEIFQHLTSQPALLFTEMFKCLKSSKLALKRLIITEKRGLNFLNNKLLLQTDYPSREFTREILSLTSCSNLTLDFGFLILTFSYLYVYTCVCMSLSCSLSFRIRAYKLNKQT